MMLAKWFGLSDPQLEENLKDRLSFRRFAGLPLTDKTPDETTFVVFRRRLREAGMDRTLFDAVARHLDGLGLLVKEGTLVDATIIEQAKGKKREDGTSTRDQDASFTKKHGRAYHGYKGHIAADASEIVTDYRFSTASHHDSRYIDEMTRREETVVYGDSAYSSGERRERLRKRGVITASATRRTAVRRSFTRTRRSGTSWCPRYGRWWSIRSRGSSGWGLRVCGTEACDETSWTSPSTSSPTTSDEP